jgi:hypothetical protein
MRAFLSVGPNKDLTFSKVPEEGIFLFFVPIGPDRAFIPSSFLTFGQSSCHPSVYHSPEDFMER